MFKKFIEKMVLGDGIVETARHKIRRIKTHIRLYKKVRKTMPAKFFVCILDSGVQISAKTVEELSEIRRGLKKTFGWWVDEVQNVWNPYEELIIVSYKSKSYEHIVLWLETTVKDCPQAILSHGKCRFEKQTQEHYALVCGKEE
jgi:hypothetical protein